MLNGSSAGSLLDSGKSNNGCPFNVRSVNKIYQLNPMINRNNLRSNVLNRGNFNPKVSLS
jgi:hypothetical protein